MLRALPVVRLALIHLVLLTGAIAATAADVTWDGGGADANTSTAANWTGDVVPGAGDHAIFDASSGVSATIDAAFTVGAITVDAAYTGTITQAAPVSVSGAFSLQGGAWQLGSQTLSVGGNLSIANSAGRFAAGTGTVTLAGSGDLSNPHASNAFHDLVVPAGHMPRLVADTVVTHLATVAGTLAFRDWSALRLRGSGQLLSVTGSLNAFSNGNRGKVLYEATSATPVQVEGLYYGYTQIALVSLGGVAAVFDQAGAITGIDSLYSHADTAGGSITWNLNNHSLTSAAWLTIGNWGASLGGTTINAGSATVTVPVITWFTRADDVLNLQSSSWNVGMWGLWQAGGTVNPGTSTVTITGSEVGPSWTAHPHQFHNLVIASGGTVNVHGAIQALNDLTVTSGTLSTAGYAITVGRDMTIGSGGAITAGASSITVARNIDIANATGRFTAGTSTVTTGTGTLSNPHASNAFRSLTVPATKTTTLLVDTVVTHRATVAGTLGFRDWAALHLRGSGQLLSVTGALDAVTNGNRGKVLYEATSSTPVQVEGLNYGYTQVGLVSIGGAAGVFEQAGAITAIDSLYSHADTTGGSVTWNTNNHALTSAAWLTIGNWGGSLGGTTINAGSSVVTVPFITWFTRPDDVLNLQSSSWSVGMWGLWHAGGTVNPGTSTVTITGSEVGPSWTAHAHQFHNLRIQSAGSVAVHGALDVGNDLTVVSGTLNANGWRIDVARNLSVALGATLSAGSAIVGLDGASDQTVDIAGAASIGTVQVAGGVRTVSVTSNLGASALTVAAGPTIAVGSGRTLSLGALTVSGSAAEPVTLRSIAAGNAWNLVLAASGAQSLAYVRAQDSNASTGATIDASATGTDLGGNVNWLFPGGGTQPNQLPSFTKGADVTVLEDASAQTVAGWATAISPGPASESGQTVTFQVSATPAGLFSAAPAISSAGTLTFTPAVNANGVATVTVIAEDDGGTANGGDPTSDPQTFTITLTAVNDAPSFVKGIDVTVDEDAAAQTIAGWASSLSAGPADENGQVLAFTASTAQAELFSVQPSLSATGTLTFTPAVNAVGVATVSVTLADDGGTANGGANTSAAQTFTITLTAVNDAPTLAAIVDPAAILEDAAAQTVALSGIGAGGGADEAGQTLTVTAVSGTPSLIPNPTVTYTGGSTGSLAYAPMANASGTAVISVTVSDGEATTVRTFSVVVMPVNDAPSFVKGADQVVAVDSGAQTIAGWATAITAGPGEAQTVVFLVSADSPSLFAVVPAVSSAGVLTYTPAGAGSAVITVRAYDDGGLANGGVDTSAPQTFTIIITASSDPVTASFATASSSVVESAGVVSLQVQLDRPAPQAISLAYTVGGTAELFHAVVASGPLQIAAGQSTGSIAVAVIDADGWDPARNVIVTLVGGAELGAPISHALTITDNDPLPPPAASFSTSSSSCGEADGTPAGAVLVLDHAYGQPVTVEWRVLADTYPGTYASRTGSTTIPAGSSSVPLGLALIDDLVRSGGEIVTIQISGVTGGTVGDTTTHVLTILDNEPVVSVAFAAATASSSEGAGLAQITIAISPVVARDVVVPIQLGVGSASVGADFTPPALTAVILAGQPSATIAVPLIEDSLSEVGETITLSLGAIGHGDVVGTPGSHTLTILDNEPRAPLFTPDGGTFLGGGSVILSPVPAVGVVHYRVGTLGAPPSDPVPGSPGTLVFDPAAPISVVSTVVISAVTVVNEGHGIAVGPVRTRAFVVVPADGSSFEPQDPPPNGGGVAVSPHCLVFDGSTSNTTITMNASSAGGPANVSVVVVGERMFYGDVELPLAGTTSVSASITDSAGTVVTTDAVELSWTPTDVLGRSMPADRLVIRRLDSLLLRVAAQPGVGAFQIDIEGPAGQSYAVERDTRQPHRFTAAGNYLVVAKQGTTVLGTLGVDVVADPFDPAQVVAAEVGGFDRSYHIGLNPSSAGGDVVFASGDATRLIISSTSGTCGTDVGCDFRVTSRGMSNLLLRITAPGATGAILGRKRVSDFIVFHDGIDHGVVKTDFVPQNGSADRMGLTGLVVQPAVPNLTLVLRRPGVATPSRHTLASLTQRIDPESGESQALLPLHLDTTLGLAHRTTFVQPVAINPSQDDVISPERVLAYRFAVLGLVKPATLDELYPRLRNEAGEWSVSVFPEDAAIKSSLVGIELDPPRPNALPPGSQTGQMVTKPAPVMAVYTWRQAAARSFIVGSIDRQVEVPVEDFNGPPQVEYHFPAPVEASLPTEGPAVFTLADGTPYHIFTPGNGYGAVSHQVINGVNHLTFHSFVVNGTMLAINNAFSQDSSHLTTNPQRIDVGQYRCALVGPSTASLGMNAGTYGQNQVTYTITRSTTEVQLLDAEGMPHFAPSATSASVTAIDTYGSGGVSWSSPATVVWDRDQTATFSISGGGRSMSMTVDLIGASDGPADALSPAIGVVAGHAEVNVSTGNLRFAVPLRTFETPVAGPDAIAFYDSRSLVDVGHGPGWRTNYDMRLRALPAIFTSIDVAGPHAWYEPSIALVSHDGTPVRFDIRPQPWLPTLDLEETLVYASDAAGRYPGALLYRRKKADGGSQPVALDPTQPADICLPNERWELILRDNRRYYFNALGQLVRIRDLDDRDLTVTTGPLGATAVSDGTGRSVSLASGIGATLNLGESGRWTIAPTATEIVITCLGGADVGSFTHGGQSLAWTLGLNASHQVTSITAPQVSAAQHDGSTQTQSFVTNISYRARDTVRGTGDTRFTDHAEVTGAHLGTTVFEIDDTRVAWSKLIDPDGLVTEREFALGRRLEELRTRGPLTIEQTYDAIGNLLTSVVDNYPSPATEIEHVWTDLDRPWVNQLERTTVYGVEGIEGAIGPVDLVTTWTYRTDGAAFGKVATMTDPCNQGGTPTVRNIYDTRGFLTRRLDAMDRATSFSGHDAHGLPGVATTPRGRSSAWTYHPGGHGLLASETDGLLGFTRSYGYDRLRRVVQTAQSGGPPVLTGYDPFGNVTSVTDEAQHVTTSAYDAAGRPVLVDAPGDAPLVKTHHHRDPFTVMETSETWIGDELQGRRTVRRSGRLESETVTRRLVEIAPNTVAAGPVGCVTSFQYEHGHVKHVADPRGKVWSVERDAAGRVLVDKPAGQSVGTTTTYNQLGWPLSVTDAASRTSTMTYDRCGRPRRQANPAGGYTLTAYDLSGNPITVAPSLGSGATIHYDGDGVQVGVTDRHGTTTLTVYHSGDHSIATIDGGTGATVVRRLGNDGRLAQLGTPLGTTTYQRTVDGFAHTVTAPGRHAQKAERDNALRVDATYAVPAGQPGAAVMPSYVEFTANSRVARTLSPSGLIGAPVLAADTGDVLGARDNVQAPSGDPDATEQTGTVVAVDRNGNVLRSQDALGRETVTTYDDQNRPKTRLPPVAANGRQLTMTWTYRLSGEVEKVERTAPVVNGLPSVSQTTSYGYNQLGQLIETKDTAGKVVSTAIHDSIGRLLTATNGDQVTHHRYDDSGDLLSIRRNGDRVTYFQRDARGRVEARREGVTPNATDEASLPVREHFAYDHLDRRTRTTFADGSQETVTFHPNGDVHVVTDTSGRKRTFAEYDGFGRVVREIATAPATATQTASSSEITYAYEPMPGGTETFAGRLVEVPNGWKVTVTQDGVSSVRITDRRGRVVSVQHAGQDPVAMSYNLGDQLMTRAGVTYQYDGAGSPTHVGDLATLTYDGAGRLASETLPHLVRRYRYDADGRLARLEQEVGGLVEVHEITRDVRGRTLRVASTDGTWSYVFDESGRLALERRLGSEAGAHAYGYDHRDNRTSEIIVAPSATVGAMDAGWRAATPALIGGQAGGTWTVASATTVSVTGVSGTAWAEVLTGGADTGPYLRVVPTPSTLGAAGLGIDDIQGGRCDVLVEALASGDVRLAVHHGGALVAASEPIPAVAGASLVIVRRSAGGLLAQLEDGDGQPLLRLSAAIPASLTQSLTLVARGAASFADLRYDTYATREDRAHTHDASDRLLGSVITAGAATRTVGYDYESGDMVMSTEERFENGVLVGTNSTMYAYDTLRRLSRVASADDTISRFTYAPNSPLRLQQEITPSGGAAQTTTYRWDGDRVMSETAAGVTTRYHHLGRKVIAHQRDGDAAATVYGYDALGNVSGHVGEFSPNVHTLMRRFRYDAFGNVREQVVTGANLMWTEAPSFTYGDVPATAGWRYRGEWRDATGLTYLRHRYYDPNVGRFTQVDPARAGSNWYAYCSGDPVNRVDPMGLDDILLSESEDGQSFDVYWHVFGPGGNKEAGWVIPIGVVGTEQVNVPEESMLMPSLDAPVPGPAAGRFVPVVVKDAFSYTTLASSVALAPAVAPAGGRLDLQRLRNAAAGVEIATLVTSTEPDQLERKIAETLAGQMRLERADAARPVEELFGISEEQIRARDAAKSRQEALGAFADAIGALSSRGRVMPRIPRARGWWDGAPGNSGWHSTHRSVRSVTLGEPVQFRNGRVDFAPWSKADFLFKRGELTGTRTDFDLVYERVRVTKNLRTIVEAKQWLRDNRLTPHHHSKTVIQLVPTRLHANVPHVGSASQLRNE